METLYAATYINSNWFLQDQESQSANWTREENKKFESALAIYDKDTPDRWFKVAEMIPGKTVFDVIKQYRDLEEDVSDIEAGRVPIPGYLTSSFTLEMVDERNFYAYRKRSTVRGTDQERKKGVPWTEDEHRRFLLGLQKYGKGDWRNISRNFVVSKTPTQVASHAQKYFIRQQLSGLKDNKRRPSIHDITTINLTGNTPSGNDKPPLDQANLLPPQQEFASMPIIGLDWNRSNGGAVMVLDSTHGNLFMSSPYEIASHGLKLQGQSLYDTHHGAHIRPHSSMF